MAFKFISRTSSPIFGAKQTGSLQDQDCVQKDNMPPVKLTNSKLNKLAKVHPPWLRDSSGPQQLPAVYQGVLGQVQSQPAIAGLKSNVKRVLQLDYMNRFTDTERVYQLLSASLLPNETLATIWAHVNQTYPGQLTNREVCLALALIALFQRVDEKHESIKDPFNQVKLEKKPPVPKLYPVTQISHSNRPNFNSQLTSSKSTPDGLSSSGKCDLLVDFDSDIESSASANESLGGTKKSSSWMPTTVRQPSIFCDRENYCNTVANLIDMDGDKFDFDFARLTQTWMKIMFTMKNLFKRSFDILNVDHGRQSAIEALSSAQGKQFIKQLCLCYPMAHNIKCKIDELDNTRLVPSGGDSSACNQRVDQSRLFDKNYTNQIDDLMVSINEYWAVLINLFHESGQTHFIELIMDGLGERSLGVRHITIEQLASEVDGSGKSDVCSICHSKLYLITPDFKLEMLSSEDVELVAPVELLIESSQNYHYHARCANFWLNQIDQDALPFRKNQSEAILSPIH